MRTRLKSLTKRTSQTLTVQMAHLHLLLLRVQHNLAQILTAAAVVAAEDVEAEAVQVARRHNLRRLEDEQAGSG